MELKRKFPVINVKNKSRICQLHFTEVHSLKNKISKFAYRGHILSEYTQGGSSLQEDTTAITALPKTSQRI